MIQKQRLISARFSFIEMMMITILVKCQFLTVSYIMINDCYCFLILLSIGILKKGVS